MAYASARSDAGRDGWLRLGAARGRTDRRHPAWRRGLVPAGGEALARRHTDHGNEPYRRAGKARWLAGRLDGEGHRGAVSALRPVMTHGSRDKIDVTHHSR